MKYEKKLIVFPFFNTFSNQIYHNKFQIPSNKINSELG